jgi:hypothetical protein
MTISQNGKLTVRLSSTLNKTASVGGSIYSIPDETFNTLIGNGTGSNQATMSYASDLSIGVSSTSSLDISGGIVNAFGGAVAFSEVSLLMLAAAETNDADVHIGGNASAFSSMFVDPSDKLVLKPGGLILLSALYGAGAYTVTSGSGDVLDIQNTSGTSAAGVKLYIIGEA